MYSKDGKTRFASSLSGMYNEFYYRNYTNIINKY